MQLWLLRPVGGPYAGDHDDKNDAWDPWYDKAFGFVVRADSEKNARQLVYDARRDGPGDEGRDVWLDDGKTHCTSLLYDGEPGIIMRDFHAA